MDVGNLLSGTKWQLVEQIAQSPKSPNELAKALNTSIANVSIQLRTLELAAIVSKRRVVRPKMGDPRIIYSLQKNILLITSASKSLQVKKALIVNSQKEFILATWQLPEQMQQPLFTLYCTHPQVFSGTNTIAFNPSGSSDMSISLLLTGSKSTPKPITIDHSGKKIVFTFTTTQELPTHAVILYGGVNQ